MDLRDAGTTPLGDPFVVVEMLEGRTLEGLVAARGPLPIEDAFAVVREIAGVLSAAHAAGVTHDAVRPDNVLVVRDGFGGERARLVNWESARSGEAQLDAAPDLRGLADCAILALAGRARAEGEAFDDLALPKELGNVVARAAGDAGASIAAIAAALDELPYAGSSIALLEARPNRRMSEAPKESAPPSVADQRRRPRAAYRTPVRMEIAGVGAVDGRSEDISAGGLFVVTRKAVDVGARVHVRFALPIDGKVVSEAGTVKWTRATKPGDAVGPVALGIELEGLGEEATRQIERYVSLMGDDNST